MTLCTVLSRKENSITFCATSNSVKPRQNNQTREADIERLMKANPTWSKTFNVPTWSKTLSVPTWSKTFSVPSDGKRSSEEPAEKKARGSEEPAEKKASLMMTSMPPKTALCSASHGLISAVEDAYNYHHNLVFRPDDLWQAILTQFSFFVDKNAEALRDRFVDFNGKKKLIITMGGTLYTADYAAFARRMVDEEIAANLKDKDVTEWLLPNFTTTKPDDRVSASVTIMATLQSYFSYGCCLCCGIPEVTLEGSVDDWRRLRDKIDRLEQYDIDGVMTKWHRLLVPVLDNFVQSAEGNPNLEFWDTVCCHRGGGSGPSYLSGWVTVFGCFRANGMWQGGDPDKLIRETKYEWPSIETGNLPVGTISVPVEIDDHGVTYEAHMLAGQFGYEIMEDGGFLVRPRNDWCIAHTGKSS